MSFDLYGPATRKDITVGYIDPERGYISNVSICEANRYAALNPGSVFILETRDGIRYLTINQVNKLTPDDILPKETATTASCRGIRGLRPGEITPRNSTNADSSGTLNPPRIVITGGSGLGAVANPIIGRDGSILAVDLERGGFGYKSVPQVRVIDESLQGSGTVLRAVIGELPPTVEVFDQEEDFEVYDLSTCGEDPASYGTRTDPDGKPLGPWDPNLFATLAEDPIRAEIQRYQDFLQRGLNPWWTTRQETPLSVTFREKTTRVKHDVSHPAWSKNFMNQYAISPVPPSNVRGSDYAGRVCTFEWEENFPYSGEYVFRGMADNVSKVYLDNELIMAPRNFKNGPLPKDTLKKTIESGVHRIKIDLLNVPIKKKIRPKKALGGRVPVKFDVYGQGNKSTQLITYVFTSEDGKDSFTFRPGKTRGSKYSYSRTESVLPNTNYRVKATTSGGRDSGEYEYPIEFDGLNSKNNPINASSKKLKLKDGSGSDTNASFTILSSSPGVSAKFSDDGRKLLTKGKGNVTIRLKWDDNPGTAGVAVKSITIGDKTWRQSGRKGEDTKSISLTRSKKSSLTLEQGCLKRGSFTKGGKGIESSRNSDVIFADIVGSSNDNDDMQIRCGSGEFTPSNRRKTPKGRSTYDLTFRINSEVVPKGEEKSTETQDVGTIFNTVDFIGKANRKLWRTNVYGRGGFLGEYGICPFNTRKPLDGNPYAGTHIINWDNIEIPVDGNYKIEVEVDDNVKLKIGDVEIQKNGFVPNSNKGTGKSEYLRFFKKGKYKLEAELYQKPGGRFSFETGSGAAKKSRLVPRFRREGGQLVMFVDGSGSGTIDFSLKVDDNPRVAGDSLGSLRIGDVTLKRSRDGSRYRRKETITGSGTFEGGVTYPVKVSGASSGVGRPRVTNNSIQFLDTGGSDTNAELFINRIKNEQPSPVKGVNPMALAIQISADEVARTVISPKSWNQNPMGAALTIDAPMPPIPQEPIPVGEGRCPKNPIWTTRFPGASESWYPVTLDQRWSKFMNRFALSPLPPLSTPSSDGGGGITYTTSWSFEAPYRGFYALKGAVDNGGRILVDGNEILSGGMGRPRNGLAGFKNPSPQFKKFFLSEGNHTVTVEVENQKTRKYKTIIKKAFSTRDWIKPLTDGPAKAAELLVEYRGLNQGITKTITGGKTYPLKFDGLNRANNPINASRKKLKLKDGSGSDTNASFTITSTSPGVDARFSSDGRSLEVRGKGNVTLRLKWDDNPGTAGVAVKSISIGDKTWRQTGRKGDQTETINVGARDTKEVIGKGGYIVSGNSVKMKDGHGDDINSTFSIVSSTVDAKFSSDGRKIDYKGSGEITLRLKWDDNPRTAGKAVDSIAIGGKVWNQRGTKGSDTQTIQVTSDTSVRGGVESGKAIGGVTYEGPLLFNYKHKAWSKFMNRNNVSPFLPPLDAKNPDILGTRTYVWKNVKFDGGQFIIRFQSDNVGKVFINGQEVAISKGFRGPPIPSYVNLSKGRYEVKVEVNNAPPNEVFNNNPTGFALRIDLPVQVALDSKSWTDNPVGISAIMVPPPCPKVIEGKGVVTDIIAEEPGNGFPTPVTGTPGYPVTLQLTDIVPEAGGINYSPGEPVLINDIPIVPILGNFGQVVSVPVPPLIGFTEYPDISLPSETGIGFRGTPVFKPIRLPVDVLPDEDILQVTDLVGLKQTGYVNGKPYYGSVFSKDGQLFAGVYETIGELIPVYATLQESIDNQITTRPSAILRQGTDVTSNDPRLNLPGTPDNLI